MRDKRRIGEIYGKEKRKGRKDKDGKVITKVDKINTLENLWRQEQM